MFIAAEIDLAQVIGAIATLVTACGWAYSQVRTRRDVKHVRDQVTPSADNQQPNLVDAVERVQASVGATNGNDLASLIAQVIELDDYTHKAVHRIDGGVQAVTAALPEMLTKLDAIQEATKRDE